MAETKKTYIIPLRKAFQDSAPLKRGPKAMRALQSYLKKHCKVEDVKIGKQLNEAMWSKGITRPPHKVAVDVIIKDGVAKAELQGVAYVEAKKVQKKQEPETLKDKISAKLGAPAAKDDAQEQPAEQETAAEKKPVANDSPAPKQAAKTKKA